MGIKKALQDGFLIINRNWQLIFVNFGSVLLSIIGFFLIVILPIILLITKSFDFSNILVLIKSPEQWLNFNIIPKNLLIIAIILVIIYIILSTTIVMFVFSGSIGVITNAVKDKDFNFTIKSFFKQGKRLFLPVLCYTSILGLITIGIIIIGFIIGVIATAFGLSISSNEPKTVGITFFIISFLYCIIGFIGMIGTFIFFSFLIYGNVIIGLTEYRGLKALKHTKDFFIKKPMSILLYLIFFISSFILIFILNVFIELFFNLFIKLLYQILVYFAQVYISYWILAVIAVYYYDYLISLPETQAIVD